MLRALKTALIGVQRGSPSGRDIIYCSWSPVATGIICDASTTYSNPPRCVDAAAGADADVEGLR
jgi:hypothetical protein